MTELLTAAQMRAIEQAAIASGEVTGLELMERAGRGVVEAIFEEWPEFAKAPHKAVVLCGPGNNGGDGFVVARLLKEQAWDVEVFLYGDAQKLPPDARVNYERWGELGNVRSLLLNVVFNWIREADIWVDAVFGAGKLRPFERELFEFFDYVEEDPATFANNSVAIDLPSGLDSDTGNFVGPVWEPRLTLSIHRHKIGLFSGAAAGCDVLHQNLKVVDIGL